MKKIVPALFLLLCLTSCHTAQKANNDLFKSRKAEKKYFAAYNKTLKLWPVPFEEKDIPTTYGNAHVIISGPADGEPLILFHGLDASSTMWYPNVKAFTKKYRVYAIDNIAETGKSVPKDVKFGPKDIGPFYNEIFDVLKLKKLNLLGTSGGGWTATYYTIHNQDRVKKLVLLAPAETFSHIDFNPKTITAVNFKFFPTKKRLNKMLHNFSQKGEKLNPIFVNQMYLATKNSKISTDMLKMIPFGIGDLKSIYCPVLVLVGDHDVLNKPETVELAAKILPHVSAALIKDAGHFVSMDQPEEVDKRAMEFLEK